jgi:hypothetical protein
MRCGHMIWGSRARRTRSTADVVPNPPVTLAATRMPITGILATDTTSASPMDAARIAQKRRARPDGPRRQLKCAPTT